MNLTIITLTGARHEGFSLLARCLQRQTYTGPVRWIVVDDCDPMTRIPKMHGNWVVDIIRPRERWKHGQNTQARNMREALSIIPEDATVLVCEDDDHYQPGYLQYMADALQTRELVGLGLSRKWNLASRRAHEVFNPRMASLCCTGMRGKALSRFRRIAQRGPRLMDVELWRSGLGVPMHGEFVTSLKCLPGRGGIDSGHQERFGTLSDPDGSLLRQWIGDDADDYLALSPVPLKHGRRSIFTRKQDMKRTREGEIARYVEAHDDPKRRMHMGRRRVEDVRRILEGLKPGTLLDVGTGAGECLDMAFGLGHEAKGCDANPKVASDRVVTCCAHSLPFDDGLFDHVTCFDVLEHLTEDDIRPALREMFRVARQTVTVSASELPSPDGKGGDFHISKRPKAQWLALIRECWGAGTQEFGTAGRSPAFRVTKEIQ